MDLHEWELLSTDLHENRQLSPLSSNPNSLIDMDYFHNLSHPQVTVLPIEFDHEIGEIPVEEKEIPEVSSQVFFNKLKETNEFVDMKLDSPKSVNKGFAPQIDVGAYQFEEKDDEFQKEDENLQEEDEEEDNNGGLNVWKLAMNGFGAVFSFGIAAFTVSLIVLGNRHKEKHSQDLHFQLFSHDKRMKKVVHHASKLNDAINAVRGAPLTRAHITIGGYYEPL